MKNNLNNLEVSLNMGCSLNCVYCPQSLLLETYYKNNKSREGRLTFENFKKVLYKVQPGATISFSGMSEPFHNKECADMIKYAYEQGFEVWLNTTLMGMTPLDFEKIKHINFKNIFLHIPDKENRSKFIITNKYLLLLKRFIERYESSIYYYFCHGEIHNSVKGIIDQNKYDSLQPNSRAGSLNITGVENISIKGPIACYSAVSQPKTISTIEAPPVMLPDGSLVLCCQDYGMKHVLGNLITQSWDEICVGEEYKKIINGMEDDSIDILCRKCNYAKKVEELPSMMLKKYRRGGLKDISQRTLAVLDQFFAADSVCVFGLGNLWREHFYQEHWDEALNVSIFCDNNKDVQGTYINGIKCIAPSELKKYKNLLVIVFVKNGYEIDKQLKAQGINNVIFFYDIYEACCQLFSLEREH